MKINDTTSNLDDIYTDFVGDNYEYFKSNMLSNLHPEYAEKYESTFHDIIHNYSAFKEHIKKTLNSNER